MRIAVDCRMIACSGIGTFLTGILSEIILMQEHEFLLIGDEEEIKRQLKKASNCTDIQFLNFKSAIFCIKELIGFPTKVVNKWDCYFTPNFNIPLGLKIPIISTVHDVLFLDHPEIAGKIGTVIRKLWMKWSIMHSYRVLTVSEFSKQRIEFFFHKTKHVIVCGNGVKESIRHSDKKVQRDKDNPYFLYLGNLKPHKGIDVLLQAYEKYLKYGGNNKLKIVGESQQFKTKFTNNLFIDSVNVSFTGRVSEESLIDIIKNSESLIQPSLYEGFGIPPLEAMYLGTPVILSDIPVFKELYSDFPVTFFKVGDSDELCSIMLKKHDRIELNLSQRNKYSYNKVARVLINIINEL